MASEVLVVDWELCGGDADSSWEAWGSSEVLIECVCESRELIWLSHEMSGVPDGMISGDVGGVVGETAIVDWTPAWVTQLLAAYFQRFETAQMCWSNCPWQLEWEAKFVGIGLYGEDGEPLVATRIFSVGKAVVGWAFLEVWDSSEVLEGCAGGEEVRPSVGMYVSEV